MLERYVLSLARRLDRWLAYGPVGVPWQPRRRVGCVWRYTLPKRAVLMVSWVVGRVRMFLERRAAGRRLGNDEEAAQ